MERIGSTSYDYDVTTADMIRETVTGLQATAIEDVVTLPTFSGHWTQADGYRSPMASRISAFRPTISTATISGGTFSVIGMS